MLVAVLKRVLWICTLPPLIGTVVPMMPGVVPPALSIAKMNQDSMQIDSQVPGIGKVRPVFGVASPGAPNDLGALNALALAVGSKPRLVTWYEHWGYDTNFPETEVSAVAATGAVPEITWMPWQPLKVEDPAYTLDSITQGAHDPYINKWARQVSAYGHPVVLRFAHEMNGDWYPWGVGVNGNDPGDFAAAWRHVHNVFSATGATNVTWKWSPNVLWEDMDLRSLYPGDRFVDQVALDGYNWSTVKAGSSWQSFREVFEKSVTVVRDITHQPLFIGEVGCPEVGGDKAAWISDMFETLERHPEIGGFTWFDYDKETDWRVASSRDSVASFTTGLRKYRYR